MMREHPVRHDSLVDSSHLPWSRDHSETVNHGVDPVGGPVLLNQELGRKFCRAVNRSDAVERERFGDPVLGGARERLICREQEPGLRLFQAKRPQVAHGIDAARGQEHELGAMATAVFETAVGTEEIRLDGVARSCVDSGQDGRLCRAFDECVASPQRFQLPGIADVSLNELDAGSREPRQIELRAAAVQVVVGGYVPIGMRLGESDCQVAADEPGAAAHDDAHRYSSWRLRAPAGSHRSRFDSTSSPAIA